MGRNWDQIPPPPLVEDKGRKTRGIICLEKLIGNSNTRAICNMNVFFFGGGGEGRERERERKREKGVREKKEPGKTNSLINLINYSEV